MEGTARMLQLSYDVGTDKRCTTPTNVGLGHVQGACSDAIPVTFDAEVFAMTRLAVKLAIVIVHRAWVKGSPTVRWKGFTNQLYNV